MEHIRNIEIGKPVKDFFVIRWCELRHHDGKPYLTMELGCSQGRIRATYWGEDSVKIAVWLSEGIVIKIQGHGSEYKGQTWLKIERLRKAKPDEISYEKLLPRGRYTPKVLWRRLEKMIESVTHPHLAKLLNGIFHEDKELARKFATYPAAKLWHGAYTSGLIEHTLRVAKICETASSFYPDCRKELLRTGALLHDIGKVEEISTAGFFEYTERGRLIGHISLATVRIQQEIIRNPKFPPKLADELLHLIISHHGKTEWGSPVEPKTLEAMLLHHADMLDAQAEGIQHIIERDLPRGDRFSEYVKILGRFIYLDGYREK